MSRCSIPWVFIITTLALACDSSSRTHTAESKQAQNAPTPKVAAIEDPAQATAREAAMTLGRTLKKRLLEAMAQGGPTAAVSVCSKEARAITERVAQDTGARVGRASLRLRNPNNTGPDWVRARLAQLGERSANGVTPHQESVSVEGKRIARFAAPIAVEGPCLTCHGPREAIASEVRLVLDANYPSDQAHGYAEGDLRGLLWAELPIAP